LLIEHFGAPTYVLGFSHLQCQGKELDVLNPSVTAPDAHTSEVPIEAPEPEPMTLSQAISTVTGATQVYSEDKLPPSLPISFQRWEPKRSTDAPHAEYSYFPMRLYH